MQHRCAVKVALDPPDLDVQSIGEGPLGDPVGKETFAQRRVEHRQRADNHQHQRADDAQQPLATTRTAAGGGLGFAQRVLAHQKACPSEI